MLDLYQIGVAFCCTHSRMTVYREDGSLFIFERNPSSNLQHPVLAAVSKSLGTSKPPDTAVCDRFTDTLIVLAKHPPALICDVLIIQSNTAPVHEALKQYCRILSL